MRLSICLDPSRPWHEARTLAQIVDAAGWHAVYQCDHFMPHDPAGVPVAGPVTECWTTLSALAPVTSQVRLGSLVLGNTYRHPAVLASMAATLDRISGGRVVLGIGAGWQPNEHAAYGIPLPGPQLRIAALDEACTVLRALLDDGRCTFAGQVYRLDGAVCDPRPVQTRLTLLVGGAGERFTLRVAARHADVWHCWADATTFAAKSAVLDQHCDTVGRDPTSVARATGGCVEISAGRSSVRVEAGTSDVTGTASQVAEHLAVLGAAGADEFVVRDRASVPHGATVDLLHALTDDVRPLLGSG